VLTLLLIPLLTLQSCEFWIGFCEAQLEPDLLRPFLPRLIPMLMKNMVGGWLVRTKQRFGGGGATWCAFDALRCLTNMCCGSDVPVIS
jgi:hypothetical protein